ncbi:5126_t:CDS:2 [Funneliformis caledonium]|uniref:5126_t:CDS:1 n=1 Tax=Funneliformis caledonium TaxID=1117310 RepID=A0A9N8VF04_9GLOM|nr:5126_t:CDS:2 [Funneliformis caledonium]
MLQEQSRKRVAIIGSGSAGMGAAWLLSEHSSHNVTLYEQYDYLGGHTHTVDFTVPSTKSSDSPLTTPVDTGFIVFNPVTYPNLLRFFQYKNVEYIPSEMSFSVSRNKGEFEWAGKNLFTVFVQPKNLLNLEMWKTVYDIMRFNFHATDLLELEDDHPEKKMNLGEYLKVHGYSSAFKDNYLLPMTAAIWSTPPDKCALDFPALTLIQFMHNHCLLQVLNRIQWLTVKNGSRKYVETISPHIHNVRLSTKVTSITRKPYIPSDPSSPPIITITDSNGRRDEFDHVIFTTHADQALQILGDQATEDERRILGSVRFSQNRAVLHSDLSLMPINRLAFSSWNYITKSTETSVNVEQISLTYDMNILQSIDKSVYGPVLVSLNPIFEPDPSKVVGSWLYEHPQYTPATIAAQAELHTIQNLPNLATTFAGAWTKYGFHEDGFTSGLKIAKEFLGASSPFEIIDATYVRGKRADLSFVEAVQKRIWIGFETCVNHYTHLLAILCIMLAVLKGFVNFL